jgi:hypothetical protein
MMTGPVVRAGAWPAVAGVSGVAVVAGGCGAAFPGPGGGLTVGRPTGVNSVRNIRAAEGRTGTRYQALTGIRGRHKMKERLR